MCLRQNANLGLTPKLVLFSLSLQAPTEASRALHLIPPPTTRLHCTLTSLPQSFLYSFILSSLTLCFVLSWLIYHLAMSPYSYNQSLSIMHPHCLVCQESAEHL